MSASAQVAPSPFLEEAPESLLQLEVGDEEVDLFLSGGWTTGVGVGTGFSAYRADDGSLTTVFPAPFPGLESVPFFNRVDLTISLWLLNRYFFETSVSDEFELSSLLFGYVGSPGEFVQSILIGNSAIEMGAYPYLGFGDSVGVMGRETPGISALFAAERSSHEVMVRLEPSDEVVVAYSGGRIVTESHLDSASFVRDRFFILPDGNLDTLTVYAETPGGALPGSDGRSYAIVDLPARTVFSLADGTISFAGQPTGRIVVYYEAQGLPIGDSVLGADSFFGLTSDNPDPDRPADFSFNSPEELLSVYGVDVVWAALSAAEKGALENEYFRVTVDGREGFVLHEPGRYSPFERAAFYAPPTPVGPATSIGFTGPGGRSLDLPLQATPNIDGTLVSVGAPGSSVRSYAGRYPFASSGLSAPSRAIYGPSPTAQASPVFLTFRRASPVEQIVLDGNYVPGSVRVKRNGTATTSFEVSDSGEVEFTLPLAATDNVEVRYRTAASGGSGDLILGIGNRFAITPGLDADAALGMRWKPINSDYSTGPGQYPGYISLSTSARLSTGGVVSASAAAGVSYSLPDTTGVLRLNGMSGAQNLVGMSPRALFPGSTPAQDPDPSDSIVIDSTTRGALFHADYTSAGFRGTREMQSYQWEPPDTQLFAYADGGRIGPYAAISTDTEYAGRVMVMEYDLAEDRNWVAGTARINGGRATDLSGTTRIQGSFLATDLLPTAGGAVRVFLQIGALSENLDGDAAVDVGTSTVNPYLSFNDPATGWFLQAGAVSQELNAPYTEDANGNGRSDPELPDVLLTRELQAITTDDGWQDFTFDLTRADQRLLRSSRSLRFIIQRDAAGGTRAGRLVFSDVRFYGTGLAVNAPESAQVIVREIPESAVATPAGTLAAAFPAVAGRFASDGLDPAVLAVEWSGLGSDSFTLSNSITPVGESDYQELRLYARGLSAAATQVTLSAISELTGLVVASRVVAVSDQWAEIVVAMPESGNDLVDRVEVNLSGASAGEIFLDELSFWTPRDTFGATGSVEVTWSPAVELEIAGRKVISAPTIRQAIQAQTAGYADGLSASGTGIESTTDLGAALFGAPTTVGVSASYGPDGPGLQMQHSLTLPVTGARITATEFFRRSYLTYGESLQHDIGLRVGPLGPADLSLGWALARLPARTSSTWNANAAFRVAAQESDGLSSTLRATATETTNLTLSPNNYPSDWVRSFTHLVPSGAMGNDRDAGVDTGLQLLGPTVGLEMSASGGYTLSSTSGRLLTTLVAEIGIPLMLGNRIRVTPGAARSVALTAGSEASPSFSQDIATAAGVVGTQSYLITAWPLWELVDPGIVTSFSAATAGLESARYKPSVSIEVSRPIRSSPWSLVIPTRLRASASREISRDSDAVNETRTLASEVSLTAPNSFGRLGILPLFSFYDSDEVMTNATGTLKSNEDGTRRFELDVDQITRLFWLSGESLEVNTTLSTVISAPRSPGSDTRVSSTGSYRWSRPAAWLERIDRVAHLAAGASMEHTESVGVSGTWSATTTGTLTLKHASSLTFGEIGGVSLYGGLGIGRSRQSSTLIFLSGLQLGIEGHLQF